MAIELEPIGVVESPLVDLADAPCQGDEGAPDACIVVAERLGSALHGLAPGDQVIVLTWLDRADRSVLEVHPRSDPTRSVQGVFSTRSPDRPNPIGLHVVEVLRIEASRLWVRNLEAIDGTPVLDLKPVLGPTGTR